MDILNKAILILQDLVTDYLVILQTFVVHDTRSGYWKKNYVQIMNIFAQ